MLSLLEPVIGRDLEHDPKTGHVEFVGPLANPAESVAAERIITGIIDDPARDAEIQLGTAQTYGTEVPRKYEEVGVHMGQFPFPTDLTGKKVQTVDIDDIQELEKGSPGHGVAALIHEIAENYYAHGIKPRAGVSAFDVSHEAGLKAQSDVAEELVGPGRRVAGVSVTIPGGGTRSITEYENYYVVIDTDKNAATGSTDVVSAGKVARIAVNTYTIDQFGSGMRALPATAPGVIASVSGDLGKFPIATARIEGYSDDTGTDKPNLRLTTIRAEMVRDAILQGGTKGGVNRFHVIGYGASNFIVPNNSEANRARNRRVVITVDRPDI
jgi:outer membrane protein OmpA-like peptidoglycan-associated protein